MVYKTGTISKTAIKVGKNYENQTKWTLTKYATKIAIVVLGADGIFHLVQWGGKGTLVGNKCDQFEHYLTGVFFGSEDEEEEN